MFLLKLFLSFSVACIVLSQTTVNDTESIGSSVTATDCLSYIYVAWIFFIYAVGSGVQPSQFYQVSVGIRISDWIDTILRCWIFNDYNTELFNYV